MYSQHSQKALYLAALLVPLVAVGCGASSGKGAAERLPTYPVKGKVTMNGAPVPGAVVTFSPADSGKPAAIGRTDAQGNYTLTTYEADDGAVEGEFQVLVSKSASSNDAAAASGSPRDDPNYGQPPTSYEEMRKEQEEEGGSGSTLPAKYKSRGQSPLEATVTADGENEFNFDLTP